MNKVRKKVREYSSSELIEMALISAKNGNLGKSTFREVNNVDFTFMQLCSRLNKRRIMGTKVLNNSEYSLLKEGCFKSEIISIFIDVKLRYEKKLFEQREEQ